MSTTLAGLREKLSRRMGYYLEGTTTSDGAAGGTTFINSGLADKANDYFNDWYAKITSGTYTGQVRRISDFVQSTGTVTLYVAFGGQILSGITYELHRTNPDDKDTLIKEALRQIYPDLYKPVIDESLISGNWLRDGDFEDWSAAAALRYYTENSSITLAQETSIKLFGTKSAKMTSGGANAYRGQTASDTPGLLDLGGYEVTFKAWCYCATASHARLEIYTVDKDGTAQQVQSDYHPGDSRWHILTKTLTLNDDLRTIAFRFRGDVNAAIAYWDYARVTGIYLYSYLLQPTIERLDQVWLQAEANMETDEDPCDDRDEIYPFNELLGWRLQDDGTNRILRIPYAHETERKLRLIGTTFLSQPTADSGTTEIDEPETDVVVAYVASMIHTQQLGTLPADELGRAQPLAAFWQGEYERLKRKHRMISPARPWPSWS